MPPSSSEPTNPAPAKTAPAEARNRLLVEALSAFVLATAVAAVLYRIRSLDAYFHVVVAGLFLYLPVLLLRQRDLADYGLTTRPLGKNLLVALLAVVIVFPPFLAGFAIWEKLACALGPLRMLAPLPCHAGLWSHAALRLPPGLLDWHPGRNLWIAELVVVALPEEFFFRGYLQTRLDEVWRPAFGLWGARLGPSLVITAALFGLCHVAVQGNPATFAVFFPGLVFGWMRAKTGSILPGVLFHSFCNLYIETLNQSFLG